MWWYAIFAVIVNGPASVASIIHVLRLWAQSTTHVLSFLIAIGAGVTVWRFRKKGGSSHLCATRDESEKPRIDRSLSAARGLCVLSVGVIHCLPPKILEAYAAHRVLVNQAAPVLLVCMGISNSRATCSCWWYVRRFAACVPQTLTCICFVWILRSLPGESTYWKAFQSLGGDKILTTVLLSYAIQPGCIGAMWFVCTYCQLILFTPLIAMNPWVAFLPLLACSTISTLQPPFDAIVYPTMTVPCCGDGMMYAICFMPRYCVLVAAGMCVRSLERHYHLAILFAVCSSLLYYATEHMRLVNSVLRGVHPVFLCYALLCCFRRKNTFLEWVGSRSYAFYMGHLIVLNLLVKDFTIDQYVVPWIQGPLFLVLSCACGFVVHGIYVIGCMYPITSRSIVGTGICLSLLLAHSWRSPTTLSPLPGPSFDHLQYPPAADATIVPGVRPSTNPLVPVKGRYPYAFFTLVRGGESDMNYKGYDKRCRLLWPYYFDASGKRNAEDLAFHEGNVPTRIQIRLEQSYGVRFVDVHEHGGFATPPGVKTFPIRTRGFYPIGYKHMCRFFAIQWMYVMSEYRIVMRVDEDVHVHRMASNPFSFMEETRLDYAYALETTEKHKETVQTFQPWLDARHSGKERVDVKNMYFTNVFVSRVGWWHGGAVQRFLKSVDESGNIYHHRWGDAPIQSVALKLYGALVKLFSVDYTHGSTNNEIVAGKEVSPVDYTHGSTNTKIMTVMKMRRSFFTDAMSLYENVAPCLVVSTFGLGSPSTTQAAMEILRSHIMLETRLPKSVVDDLPTEMVAKAYQHDVRKARRPIPLDDVTGVDKLNAIAESIGEVEWRDDLSMIKKMRAHKCAGESHLVKNALFASGATRFEKHKNVLQQRSQFKI